MKLGAPLVSLFLLIALTTTVLCAATPVIDSELEETLFRLTSSLATRNEIIKRFQQYLQLPTQQPTPNYKLAMEHLTEWSREIFPSLRTNEFHQISSHWKRMENDQVAINVFHCIPSKPSFILTWKGQNPQLGSILFNSHMDIVPADKDQWKYPPFDATLETFTDSEGKEQRRIYSRGSQDMKNVGAAHMEALQILSRSKFQSQRNLHVLFVADEEIGGKEGWGCLLSEEHEKLWKELNVRFGVDEGIASGLNNEVISIFHAEKVTWWFEIEANGQVGHGSQFIKETATEKIYKLLRDRVFPFRDQQQVQMRLQTTDSKQKTTSSSVVSINLTGLKSGHVDKETGEFSNPNVIPRTAVALFDMRVPPQVDLKEVDLMLQEWAKSINGTLRYIHNSMINSATNLRDEMVQRFLKVVNERMKTELIVVPAATDARYPRSVGVNVLGYSFMPNTKVLLHDNDEYLDEKVYLESIVHYVHILKELLVE